jgi:hypothetical protein
MALTFNTGRLAQSGDERKSCSWTVGQQLSHQAVYLVATVVASNNRGCEQSDEDRDELMPLSHP